MGETTSIENVYTLLSRVIETFIGDFRVHHGELVLCSLEQKCSKIYFVRNRDFYRKYEEKCCVQICFPWNSSSS